MEKLSHDFLKKNEVLVKLKEGKSIVLGEYEDLKDVMEVEEILALHYSKSYKIENKEIILKPESLMAIKVTFANHHYEVTCESGLRFDICFEDDEQMNEYLEVITVLQKFI
jgi:hypothetical protein